MCQEIKRCPCYQTVPTPAHCRSGLTHCHTFPRTRALASSAQRVARARQLTGHEAGGPRVRIMCSPRAETRLQQQRAGRSREEPSSRSWVITSEVFYHDGTSEPAQSPPRTTTSVKQLTRSYLCLRSALLEKNKSVENPYEDLVLFEFSAASLWSE